MKEKIKLIQSLKILFVDDEDEIREIINNTFSNLNVDITMAANGLEAFDIFNGEDSFDLIITDINMPKMDGLVLAKSIKELDENMPIVIMSAHTDKEYKEKAKSIGIEEYLTKPFDFIKFLNLIWGFDQLNVKKTIISAKKEDAVCLS